MAREDPEEVSGALRWVAGKLLENCWGNGVDPQRAE